MNAFRKRPQLTKDENRGSKHINTMIAPSTKTVITEENPEPTTFVEMTEKNVVDYSRSLGLPNDSDYQLRDMLKSGNVPKEVDVHGMLDSKDPLDLKNQGVADVVMDRLNPEPEPAPAPEPTPSVEPSNE